jgi:hypothetical protein
MSDAGFQFGYGGVVRTARRLFEGHAFIPAGVWDGKSSGADRIAEAE